MRKIVKKILLQNRFGSKLLEFVSHKRKLLHAKRFLEYGYLFSKEDQKLILEDYEQIAPYTQLSIAGIINLEDITREIISSKIHGAFVECGTWNGGAVGYFARSLIRNHGDPFKYPIFAFDSFQGMPNMTKEDGVNTAEWLYGKKLEEVEESFLKGELKAVPINVANYQTCKKVILSSGYPSEKVHIRKGWFQDTIPKCKEEIGDIAVLRIDADLYKSTKFCLCELFDQVVKEGFVIIDDYGTFEGCKRAVDEFLREKGLHVRLIRVDLGIRYFQKR